MFETEGDGEEKTALTSSVCLLLLFGMIIEFSSTKRSWSICLWRLLQNDRQEMFFESIILSLSTSPHVTKVLSHTKWLIRFENTSDSDDNDNNNKKKKKQYVIGEEEEQ